MNRAYAALAATICLLLASGLGRINLCVAA